MPARRAAAPAATNMPAQADDHSRSASSRARAAAALGGGPRARAAAALGSSPDRPVPNSVSPDRGRLRPAMARSLSPHTGAPDRGVVAEASRDNSSVPRRAWSFSVIANVWAWVTWGWRMFSTICAVLCLAYSFNVLSVRSCIIVLALIGAAGGAFLCTLWRSRRKARETEEALAAAETRAQELDQQARQYQTQLGAQEAELQRRRMADNTVCKICFDREPSCALLPCRHHAFCTTCAYQVMHSGPRRAHCPLCRTPVTDVLETYAS